MTDETINKREKGYDGYKHEPENLSGPTVDKFYAEDRQALRKWFEENHSSQFIRSGLLVLLFPSYSFYRLVDPESTSENLFF